LRLSSWLDREKGVIKVCGKLVAIKAKQVKKQAACENLLPIRIIIYSWQ
jgi:hypothetical protein